MTPGVRRDRLEANRQSSRQVELVDDDAELQPIVSTEIDCPRCSARDGGAILGLAAVVSIAAIH
jgi:hypothetical protein